LFFISDFLITFLLKKGHFWNPFPWGYMLVGGVELDWAAQF
jgi:hypothetical protein